MKKRSKTFYKLLIAGVVVLLILGLTVLGIHLKKAHHEKKEEREKAETYNQGPLVKVYKAKGNNAGKEITLIGEARPFESSTLYAQISGYLQKIMVDKGDHVEENEILALVDNPQIDQQYNAAQADLTNKQRILERDQELLKKKYISEEQADLSETNVETAQATLNSLREQQAYKTIRAPFEGTITDRYVDPGAMIQSAVGSQSGSQPIVTIATLDKLRVYVYVEQKDAGFLRNGYPVEITANDKPEKPIKGTITRFAGQLDPHTRMMLVEVDIDNHDKLIVPGSYVTVHIQGPANKENNVQIPSNGLVVHKDKTMVAIIDKDTTLHFRPVTIGYNNGDSVTLLTGVKEGDMVAIQVGENFNEGQKVRIQQDSTRKQGNAQQGGQGSEGQSKNDSTGNKKGGSKNDKKTEAKEKKMEKKSESSRQQ